MSHTPGPWIATRTDWRDEPSPFRVYISGNQHECHDEDDEDDEVRVCITGIAIVEGNATSQNVTEANARLIAAAPLLLAACEKARAAYDHNVHTADIVCALEAALPSIEAAICAALPAPTKSGE